MKLLKLGPGPQPTPAAAGPRRRHQGRQHQHPLPKLRQSPPPLLTLADRWAILVYTYEQLRRTCLRAHLVFLRGFLDGRRRVLRLLDC